MRPFIGHILDLNCKRCNNQIVLLNVCTCHDCAAVLYIYDPKTYLERRIIHFLCFLRFLLFDLVFKFFINWTETLRVEVVVCVQNVN